MSHVSKSALCYNFICTVHCLCLSMLSCIFFTETLQFSMFFELPVPHHLIILRLFFFLTHLGPAQVPMMSPNGSVPTIYVPPGYAPQVWPFDSFFSCVHADCGSKTKIANSVNESVKPESLRSSR